ncbi:hypothetical protein EDC01DRAFT_119554 [Geopyxis carbonaria]|nr:hypothetical protein EDC01DRAFT_119554 [Geopyxis carbonaria]
MRGTSQQPRGNPRGRPRKRQRGGGRVSEAPIPDPSVFLHYPLTAPTSEASITQQYQPPSTPSTFNGSVTPIPHPTSVMHPAPPSSHVNDTNRGAHSETPQIGATDQAGGPESMTPSLLFQIQNSRSGSSSEDNYMSKTSSPALFYGKLPLPHISAPPSGTASPPPLPNIPNGNSEISLPIYVEKALPVNCEGQRPAARQPSGPLAVTLRKRKAERQAIVDHTTSEDDGGEEESPGVTPQPTLVHQQAPPKAVRGRGRGGRPRGRGRGRGRGTAPTSAATSRDATPALSVRAVAAATGARGGGRGRGKRLRLTHFEEDLDTRSRLPDFEWYTTPEGRCTVQKPAREAMEWPNYKRERALLDRRNQLIQKAPKSRRFLRMVQNRRDELRRLWREGAAALVDFNEEVGKNSYEEVFRSRRIFGETDLGKKTAEDLQVFETKPFSREDDVFKLCQRHQSDTFVAEKLSLEQSTRMLLVEAAERAIRSYLHEGHEDTRDLLAAKIPLIELLICYVTGISDIRAVTINDLRAAFLDQLGHDKTEWDEPQPAIRSNEGLYERTILKTQSAQDRENSIPKLKKAYGELKVGSLRIQVLENGMDWMTWRRNGSVRILPPEPRELDDDMHSKYSNMGEIDKGLTYIILPDDDKDEEKEENDEEMLETYQHEGASAGYVQDWRTDPTNLAQFYQSVGATTIECESINALMTLAMDNGEARAPVPKMESKIQYPYPVNSLCLDRKTRNTRIRDFAIQLPEILMENLRLSITSALDACGSSSDCPAPESSTVGAEVVPTPTKVKHPKPRSKPHPLRQSERASSVESVDTIEDSDDEWETLVRESSSISEYEDEENMAAEKVQEKDEDGVVDEMMVDVEEDVPFVETNVPEPELREDNTEIGENQEVDMIGGSISTVSDGEATATGTGEAERIQGFATVPSAIGRFSVHFWRVHLL